MPERAVLHLRGGGRLEVFPLAGPEFGSDLHQVLQRAAVSGSGSETVLSCRTSDGQRTSVRVSEIQAVTVTTYELGAVPLRSAPVPWPPPLEHKPAST